MKLSTKDLTFYALLLAALIAGGYVLFILSRTIPIPGIKYVIMSPYFSLVLMLLMSRTPRKGAILLFNTGFAGIMSLMTPVMGFAILATGAMTECVFQITEGRLNILRQQSITAASYSAFSVLTSIVFAYWLTDVLIYELIGLMGTLALSLTAFTLGMVGSFAGILVRRRMAGRA